MKSGSLLVNLGCGSVYHPDWVNLDSIPAGDLVRRWDIRRPLPFKAGEVDACYASHVLEHLPRSSAEDLLQECRRVLKPGGIIRLAVPDLEGIASAYLKSVHSVANGEAPIQQHEWMTIELIDQMVRREGGGEMHRTLVAANNDQRKFIIGRIGAEAENVFFPVKPAQTIGGRSPKRFIIFAACVRSWLVLWPAWRWVLRAGLRSGKGYFVAPARCINGCTIGSQSKPFWKMLDFLM